MNGKTPCAGVNVSALRRAVLTAAMTLCACTPPASALFDVDGVQKYEECLGEAFPFEPIFHAYRERSDSVGLFFQSRGGHIQSVDVVHFEVFDPDKIETGTPIPMDPIVLPETRVASGVELAESCTDLDDSLGLTGSIVFDSFSQEIDGLIAGEVDGALESLRTGDAIATSFTGTFEFTVQIGQPYEEFRN